MKWLCIENKVSVDPDSNHVPERALRFGDGFFESVLLLKGRIQLWDEHYSRIQQAMRILQMDASALPDTNTLSERILALIGDKQNARIRLGFYREGSGNYTAMNQSLSIGISLIDFDLKRKDPLRICLYRQNVKPVSAISNIKSLNSLIYVLAGKEAAERGFDEAVILNQKERLSDCGGFNIYVIKDEVIYTPSLFEAAVSGAFRQHLKKCFQRDGLVFQETAVSEQQLLDADEIFLSNAVFGICRVAEYEGRKLAMDRSRELQLRYNFY